jgi:hypothetical protein
MPIRRYADEGVVFTPQALSAMGKALVPLHGSYDSLGWG